MVPSAARDSEMWAPQKARNTEQVARSRDHHKPPVHRRVIQVRVALYFIVFIVLYCIVLFCIILYYLYIYSLVGIEKG